MAYMKPQAAGDSSPVMDPRGDVQETPLPRTVDLSSSTTRERPRGEPASGARSGLVLSSQKGRHIEREMPARIRRRGLIMSSAGSPAAAPSSGISSSGPPRSTTAAPRAARPRTHARGCRPTLSTVSVLNEVVRLHVDRRLRRRTPAAGSRRRGAIEAGRDDRDLDLALHRRIDDRAEDDVGVFVRRLLDDRATPR